MVYHKFNKSAKKVQTNHVQRLQLSASIWKVQMGSMVVESCPKTTEEARGRGTSEGAVDRSAQVWYSSTCPATSDHPLLVPYWGT